MLDKGKTTKSIQECTKGNEKDDLNIKTLTD